MVSEQKSSRKRALGLWMCTALVVGNMIGSGVFLLPAALGAFGSISILGWLFTAAGAMLLASIFARLSRVMPVTGGPYSYIRFGFGDFAAFLVAWGYWISILAGNAAIAIAFIGYLAVFLPALREIPLAAGAAAVFTIWLLTWVNANGIRSAGFVQLITTILKLVPLFAIATFGLLYIKVENFIPFNATGDSSFAAITASATLTLWAFAGLESATIPADEVIDPKRTIPRATILGTVFAAVIYILSTIAVMGVIPPGILSHSTAPFADAAQVMWGSWAGYAIAAGAALACLGALNGWILLQGQIPLAMARDSLFPKFFRRLSNNGTPVLGLVVSSIFVTLLLTLNYNQSLVKQFTFIILLSTLTLLLLYTLSAMAEIMVFIRDRKRFSGKRMLGRAVVAVLAFLYSMWAIAGAGMETVYWGFLLFLAGIPIYVWIKWKESPQQ